MRTLATGLLVIAVLLSTDSRADIYRCTDSDGNMMFSQFPCAEEQAQDEKAEVAADGAAAEEPAAPAVDNTADVVTPVSEDKSVEVCKKPYRDAIDAIEARMLDGYTPEQGAAYKKQLLGLTRGLRGCES